MTGDDFQQQLVEKFFANDEAYLQTEAGRAEFRNHVDERPAKYRRLYKRWLEAAIGPAGKRVLEVGVGTGCASLVLAECGYHVSGIEISRQHADVAVARLKKPGFSYQNMFIGNAQDVISDIDVRGYDAVLIWATLEHLTLEERQATLTSLWGAMSHKAKLFIIECPNRLWHYDTHTAQLPFYHWLPDEYAREMLRRAGRKVGGGEEPFARTGRAASYHELLMANIPVDRAATIDSLQLFARRNHRLKWIKWALNADGRRERVLYALGRDVHRAFFHEYLDLYVEKSD